MTEEEWLECADPAAMLEFLRGKASERKLRLFAGACRIRPSLPRDFWWGEKGTAEAAGQAVLLRELFGNPFRPSPPLPHSVLGWNDGTVRRIAVGIYEDHAFDRLPVLADALLDAGCDEEELIRHFRSAGPHVRGCWALDRILGKE
jgi:hypothetical protein